jgi:putative hemolysin
MTAYIVALIILLLLSAFFSASEVAFVSLSDAKIEAMVKRKLHRASLIQRLMKNPRRLLVTILIGNNIVNIAASSLATVVTAQLFDSAVIGITTGVMTLLVLFFGEIIPKTYATSHPKKWAIFVAPTLRLFQWVIFPIVSAFEWLSHVFAGKPQTQHISEEELRSLARVSSRQGAIEENEGVMIERLFAFNDITAEDIMTPRVRMVAIPDNTALDDVVSFVSDHPFTRYPVMQESPDHIIGFVHSRDLLLAQQKIQKKWHIKDILLPIIYVPKQMPIDNVMREFQKRKTHMALVVDEFGGTEGLVTFEDVIEELVGEITDEHDIGDNMIKRIDKNTIIVSADTTLRDINDFLVCVIPGNELDTVAEVILDALQKIPRKNQSVTLESVRLTIQEVKKRRISIVKVEKLV